MSDAFDEQLEDQSTKLLMASFVGWLDLSSHRQVVP